MKPRTGMARSTCKRRLKSWQASLSGYRLGLQVHAYICVSIAYSTMGTREAQRTQTSLEHWFSTVCDLDPRSKDFLCLCVCVRACTKRFLSICVSPKLKF